MILFKNFCSSCTKNLVENFPMQQVSVIPMKFFGSVLHPFSNIGFINPFFQYCG